MSGPSSTARGVDTASRAGMRSALLLAVGPASRERRSLNVHASLNLLNRLLGTDDPDMRAELAGRLADYLAATHRVEERGLVSPGALWELARNYAAMRYLMADAIEPRIAYTEPDFDLRTEQAAEMMVFLQCAIDSLLTAYVPRIEMSVRPLAWWKVEIRLAIELAPGQEAWTPPSGWQPQAAGGYECAALFTARARNRSF